MWFVMRLCMYPYVCWSAHIESQTYYEWKWPAAWLAVGFLWTLQVLQAYWFGLIIKAAITKMRKGNVEDVRSDDEDEDEEPKKE